MSLAIFPMILVAVPGGLVNVAVGYVMMQAYDSRLRAQLVGMLTCFLGLYPGSLVSFFIGRYILLNAAKYLTNRFKILKALDAVIAERGIKTCVLLRLCPLVPFNALNYAMGATSISFKEYAIGSISVLWQITMSVAVGIGAKNIVDLAEGKTETGWAQVLPLVAGIVFALVLGFYLGCLISRYLKR